LLHRRFRTVKIPIFPSSLTFFALSSPYPLSICAAKWPQLLPSTHLPPMLRVFFLLSEFFSGYSSSSVLCRQSHRTKVLSFIHFFFFTCPVHQVPCLCFYLFVQNNSNRGHPTADDPIFEVLCSAPLAVNLGNMLCFRNNLCCSWIYISGLWNLLNDVM